MAQKTGGWQLTAPRGFRGGQHEANVPPLYIQKEALSCSQQAKLALAAQSD